MQSPLEVLGVPSAFARRRQSPRTGWLLAQHCAAMSVLGSCRDTSRPTDEVTASSPGHRQKRWSVSSVLESPAKMATPDAGMGASGKLGGEGSGGDGGGNLAKGHGSPE